MGKVVEFSATHRDGSSCLFFLTKLAYSWHRQRTKDKGQKLFKPWLKKYTWQVYIEMKISSIVKSVQKITCWARSPRAEIFKILHFVDTLVFKDTKWPTSVYMHFVPKSTSKILPSTRKMQALVMIAPPFTNIGLDFMGLYNHSFIHKMWFCWIMLSFRPLSFVPNVFSNHQIFKCSTPSLLLFYQSLI